MATPNKSYAKHPRQPGSSVSSLPADVLAVLQREYLDKQAYLMEHYPDWDESELIYRKGR